jgi:hypothetical protein
VESHDLMISWVIFQTQNQSTEKQASLLWARTVWKSGNNWSFGPSSFKADPMSPLIQLLIISLKNANTWQLKGSSNWFLGLWSKGYFSMKVQVEVLKTLPQQDSKSKPLLQAGMIDYHHLQSHKEYRYSTPCHKPI